MPEDMANDLGDEGLSEEGPVIHFTSVDNLERTVQDFQNAFFEDPSRGGDLPIHFKNVPYDAFQQLCDKNECSITCHCRLLYFEDTETLIVKMTISAHHEAAAMGFTTIFISKILQMGLRDAIKSRGAALAHMGQVHKQPDQCWGPANKNYVTLVLEVGASQSQQGLTTDAHRWIESPNSHVQQVVGIKIRSDQPTLIFRKWVAESAAYMGTLRSSSSRRATMTQEVTVSLVNNTPTADGSLSLNFSDIFERAPNPGSNESDIVLNPDDFCCIATDVWKLLGYMGWE